MVFDGMRCMRERLQKNIRFGKDRKKNSKKKVFFLKNRFIYQVIMQFQIFLALNLTLTLTVTQISRVRVRVRFRVKIGENFKNLPVVSSSPGYPR